MPEAVGIGELWMAKTLSGKFTILLLQKAANDWYQRFTVLTIRAYSDANTGCGEFGTRPAAANDGVSGGCGM